MIIWSDKLFLSDSIKAKNLKKLKKIKKKLEKPNRIRFGAHLITVNTGGRDLLDIYSITFFPAKHYKTKEDDIHIVGVAGGSEEAQELAGGIIARLVKDGYELSPAGIKSYFEIKSPDVS